MAIVASHILLLAGFLLQYDMGDDFGWIAAVALVRGKEGAAIRGTIREEYPFLFNILAFVPAAISWLLVVLLPRLTGKAK